METNLTFQYDKEADILYVNTCPPYPEQKSGELADEIIARFNPDTGDIENLEVLFFLRGCCAMNCLICRFPLVCS